MKKPEPTGETVKEYLERTKPKRTHVGRKEARKPEGWLERKLRTWRKRKLKNRTRRMLRREGRQRG